MGNYYDDLAYKLIPSGTGHLTLTWTRDLIARTVQKEVEKALTKQREEQFPDLITAKNKNTAYLKELDEYKAKLSNFEKEMNKENKQREEELEERNQQLIWRESVVVARETQLNELLKAFSTYMAWLDGDGQVDENAKRFAALRQAYLNFKEQDKQ